LSSHTITSVWARKPKTTSELRSMLRAGERFFALLFPRGVGGIEGYGQIYPGLMVVCKGLIGPDVGN
jgi:hypothetical protein